LYTQDSRHIKLCDLITVPGDLSSSENSADTDTANYAELLTMFTVILWFYNGYCW